MESLMNDDQLDLVFGAISDRTRRGILARLVETDANVADLTALFTMSQPAISKHLKVLEQAGLISRNQQGTMRLSHLQAGPLKEATTWLADYRAYWGESYDRLDELFTTLNETDKE
jgi:DNA-binding transcriptional ArsR family regulator